MANKIEYGITALGTTGTVTIDFSDTPNTWRYRSVSGVMTGNITLAFANAQVGDEFCYSYSNSSGGPLDLIFPTLVPAVKGIGGLTSLVNSIPDGETGEATGKLKATGWECSLQAATTLT